MTVAPCDAHPEPLLFGLVSLRVKLFPRRQPAAPCMASMLNGLWHYYAVEFVHVISIRHGLLVMVPSATFSACQQLTRSGDAC